MSHWIYRKGTEEKIPLSIKDAPPEEGTSGNMSFHSTKSGWWRAAYAAGLKGNGTQVVCRCFRGPWSKPLESERGFVFRQESVLLRTPVLTARAPRGPVGLHPEEPVGPEMRRREQFGYARDQPVWDWLSGCCKLFQICSVLKLSVCIAQDKFG